jgi:transcriptional regulator with XRE-family HTH domain
MDDLELGTRIAHWRERRGITQKLLADRIGRSKSWIEKVEAGSRSANRLPILLTICKELRIDLPVLIGRDPARDTRECIDDLQVETIRAALERYDTISDEVSDGYQPDTGRLRRQLVFVWSAFEQADYHVVSQNLPALLLDAPRSCLAKDSDEATALLSEVYQVTASTLRKLGEYEYSFLGIRAGPGIVRRMWQLVVRRPWLSLPK